MDATWNDLLAYFVIKPERLNWQSEEKPETFDPDQLFKVRHFWHDGRRVDLQQCHRRGRYGRAPELCVLNVPVEHVRFQRKGT
jgi:hypothetical protein